MLPVDEESKQRLVADLGKLITFSSDLGNKQLWNEARIVFGELGDTSSRLLAGNTREDLALSASLSELDESVEALRNSYGRKMPTVNSNCLLVTSNTESKGSLAYLCDNHRDKSLGAKTFSGHLWGAPSHSP